MSGARTRLSFHALIIVAAIASVLSTVTAHAAPRCNPRKQSCSSTSDATAPVVLISSPSPGATVSGTISVTGSASDNVALAKIEVAIDAGSWQLASGTTSWSWSWNTSAVADGTHTVAARATDTSGNVAASSQTITVGNTIADTASPSVGFSSPTAGATVSGTVSVTGTSGDDTGVARVDVSIDGGSWQIAAGTASWTFSWDTTAATNATHTMTVRATDTSGNTSSASRSFTVSNVTASPSPTPTASTAQHWVSPEGLTIDIDSTGGWTVDQIYRMVKDNAAGPGDFARIAPTLTVKVQDVYASSTRSSASTSNGVYTYFAATIYLLGNGGTFPAYPNDVTAHEYGHAWSDFHLFIDRQGDWSSYLAARWSNADGSLRLANDARLDSSYMWKRAELIADDYRLLFGTAAAIAERPRHLNWEIVDPRNVTGLRSFFLNDWA